MAGRACRREIRGFGRPQELYNGFCPGYGIFRWLPCGSRLRFRRVLTDQRRQNFFICICVMWNRFALSLDTAVAKVRAAGRLFLTREEIRELDQEALAAVKQLSEEVPKK